MRALNSVMISAVSVAMPITAVSMISSRDEFEDAVVKEWAVVPQDNQTCKRRVQGENGSRDRQSLFR